MADSRLIQLTSTDATASSDWMLFTDDPGGTPVSKARAISDILADHTAASTDMDALTSTTTIVTPAALGTQQGSDFPASPVTNQQFFRTDLGFDCYWDGTRWLTKQRYRAAEMNRDAQANAEERNILLKDTNWDIYMTQVSVNTYVDTTNNTSDYWTVEVQGHNLARSAESVFYSVNTAADSANTWTDHSGTATDASPTNQVEIIYDVSSNGTPGALNCRVQVYYRYIIT